MANNQIRINYELPEPEPGPAFTRCGQCSAINTGKTPICLTCGSNELTPISDELPFGIDKACESCRHFQPGFQLYSLEATRTAPLTGECDCMEVGNKITVRWAMLCNGNHWSPNEKT